MSRKPKDLVALIVDCGPTMKEQYSEDKTYMDIVKTCLSQLIEQKIFSQSRSDYILIGLGIDSSKNVEECEYPFVGRLSDLGVPNLKLLKIVQSLEATDNVGKLIDALSFAAEVMHTLPNPKTKYDHKKIGLFTNFSFTIDGPEAIVYSCNIGKPRELCLSVLCRYTFEELSAKRNLFPCHDHFLQLLINLDSLASVVSFDFALTNLPYFEPSEQNSAPWHTKIFVGDDLMFPVTGFIKTTEHKKRTWSKSYIEPSEKDLQNYPENFQTYSQASIPLSRNVNYTTSDESKIELEKEEVAKAYLLGKTIVPVTPEDEEAMKFQSHLPPAVRVLFWTSQDNVRPFFFTGNRSMIFIPDIKAKDFVPCVVFNVLTHSMLDSKTVAIVSMMRTIRCNPQIGCLTPCYMGDSLVLIYNQLPFAEDIRHYTFPPLVDEKNRPRDVPSNSELDVIDDLIKMMSLVEKDANGHPVDYLNCEVVRDPFDRIQFKAIVHRYLNPNVPLPKKVLEDYSLSTPAHILKRCEGVFRNIKEKFKLVEALKRFSSLQNTDNISSPSKRIKSENDLDAGLSSNKDFLEAENEASKSRQKPDSKAIETFTKFTQQLNELSKDLLGFNDAKIIKIFEEFRNKSIEYNIPHLFNQFMMSFKQKISLKSAWKLIVKKQITLISNAECSASEISPDEALQFIK